MGRYRAATLLVLTLGACSCRPSTSSDPGLAPLRRHQGPRLPRPETPPRQAPPVDTNPRFVDVASQAGLTAVLYGGGERKDHLLESVGTGAAFVDYDEDGRLDVYLVNAWALDEEPSRVRTKGRNVLYRNRGDGTFEDVTSKAGVSDESWGCGVCAGDYRSGWPRRSLRDQFRS